MEKTPASEGASLAERLQRRAEALPEQAQPGIIRRVITARRVLSQQRRRGLPWTILADLLAEEGVALTAGTLRNYIAMISRAEAALRAVGHDAPSDDEIHAALRAKPAPALKPKVSHASAQPPAIPAHPVVTVPATHPPYQPAPPPRQSLTRNPNRDL